MLVTSTLFAKGFLTRVNKIWNYLCKELTHYHMTIPDVFKWKAFADNKINVTQEEKFVKVMNCGKKENI